MEAKEDGIYVTMEGDHPAKDERFDRVLMAIGRKPNGKLIDAEKAGVKVDERGFIPVDKQLRTNVPHILLLEILLVNLCLLIKLYRKVEQLLK